MTAALRVVVETDRDPPVVDPDCKARCRASSGARTRCPIAMSHLLSTTCGAKEVSMGNRRSIGSERWQRRERDRQRLRAGG